MMVPGSIAPGVADAFAGTAFVNEEEGVLSAPGKGCVNEEEGVISVEPARVMSEPGNGVAHFTQRIALA